jgi:hypothetical protein
LNLFIMCRIYTLRRDWLGPQAHYVNRKECP